MLVALLHFGYPIDALFYWLLFVWYKPRGTTSSFGYLSTFFRRLSSVSHLMRKQNSPRGVFDLISGLKERQVRTAPHPIALLKRLSIDPQQHHPSPKSPNQATTKPFKQQQQQQQLEMKRNGNLKCLPASLTCRQLTKKSS